MARPDLPALAVLPARCENVFGSVGGSYWMTVSISAKSTPLAATSVQSNTAGDRWDEGWVVNVFNAVSRTRGGRSPCNEMNLKVDSSGSLLSIWIISFSLAL